MVVYQPNGLDMCIDYGGTHEFEASLLQIPANFVAQIRCCGDFGDILPGIYYWPEIGKFPHVFVETAEFLLNFQEFFSIINGGFDFPFISDNPGIIEEFFDFLVPIS